MKKTKKYEAVSNAALINAAEKAINQACERGYHPAFIFGYSDAADETLARLIGAKNRCHKFMEAAEVVGGFTDDEFISRIQEKAGLVGLAYAKVSEVGSYFPDWRDVTWQLIKLLGQGRFTESMARTIMSDVYFGRVWQTIGMAEKGIKSPITLMEDWDSINDEAILRRLLDSDELDIHTAVRVAVRMNQIRRGS